MFYYLLYFIYFPIDYYKKKNLYIRCIKFTIYYYDFKIGSFN